MNLRDQYLGWCSCHGNPRLFQQSDFWDLMLDFFFNILANFHKYRHKSIQSRNLPMKNDIHLSLILVLIFFMWLGWKRSNIKLNSLTKVYLCLIHYNHNNLLLSHYEQSAKMLLKFTEEKKLLKRLLKMRETDSVSMVVDQNQSN